MRTGMLAAAAWLATIVPCAAADAPPDVAALTKQLQGSNVPAAIAAAEQLGQLGPAAKNAVPALARAAATGDLALRHEAVISLGRLGGASTAATPTLTTLLGDESLLLRHGAAHALRMIGPGAKSAVPALKKSLGDKEPLVAVAAAWALARLDRGNKQTAAAIVPVLVAALDAKSSDVAGDAVLALREVGGPAVPAIADHFAKHGPAACIYASDALGLIGAEAASAVPLLVKQLASADAAACWHAARALGEIGAHAETVVPALRKALSNPAPSVKGNAAHAIGRFGAAGQPAVTDLATLLKDKDANVRIAGARALGAIGPDSAPAVAALVAAFADAEGGVTIAAADALGQIGSPAAKALAEKLSDPNYRTLAAATLGQIGEGAVEAVPALVKQIDVEDAETRREVLLAIAEIGPAAKAAVPALLAKLQRKGDPGRAGAAYALGKIGAEEAVPALKGTVAATEDPRLQLASAFALVHIQPENDEFAKLAIPGLTKGLDDEWSLVRRESAGALGLIGPRAKGAAAALKKRIADEDPAVQVEALNALIKTEAFAASDLPLLIALLDAPNQRLHYLAGYAIGQLGTAAKSALPNVRAMLDSGDPFERTVGAWALLRVEPTAANLKTALPLLLPGMSHPNPRVRVVIAQALGQFGKGDAAAKAALESAAKDDDDAAVRDAATAALQALGK